MRGGRGVLFGLPSLRIKGFYLAVATLAAQFFIVWALVKFPWFSNYSSSGVISTQEISILGFVFDGPTSKYMLTLAVVVVLALAAKNMVRSSTGRAWMAVRDMDVAAEVIGIRPMRTKLIAFAVSSFYCGVAGALYAYTYLGTVETRGLQPRSFVQDPVHDHHRRNRLDHGLLPRRGLHRAAPHPARQLRAVAAGRPGLVELRFNFQLIVFGGMIIFFLIVEPHGLARLWQIGKEKLRLWPFPH